MAQKATVIGAGIIGMCAASYLQRAGVEVTVLDPVAPGMSCSFGNAGALSSGSCVPLASPGVLRQVPKWLIDDMGPLTVGWRHLPRALPWLWRFVHAGRAEAVERSADALIALTRPLFENLKPLVAEAGAERLIQRVGQLHVYSTEAAFEGDRSACDLRRRRGVDFEVLAAEEIRQFEPALAPIFQRAIWFPDHGHCANPFGLVDALAKAFRRNGGQILERRVLDIEFGPDGPRTLATGGGPMPVETLVVAAGAWSHRLAGMLGHKVPLETQRGYHALLQQGRAMFPGLEGGEVSRWMGHRPCLPYSVPVIVPSLRVKNTYFAFGHGHIGLTCASTTGRLIAELATGAKPCIDPAPYRIDRF